MKFWIGGKLAGGAVGFAVGGPVGALVGLAVGHALDHYTEPDDPDEQLALHRERRARREREAAGKTQGARRQGAEPASHASERSGERSAKSARAPRKRRSPQAPPREELDQQARLAFASHLIALFAAVAQADGTVRRQEVKVIRQFFETQLGLRGEDLDLVRALLKEALAAPVEIGAAARSYRAHAAKADCLLFLQALYEMVCEEGAPASAEQKIINQIVVGLEIGEADHHAVRAIFLSEPSLEQDYLILGLAPGGSGSELKRAFRTLAARHHPDRVTHLGPDAVALAGKRFVEIKAAYDRIRRARGR